MSRLEAAPTRPSGSPSLTRVEYKPLFTPGRIVQVAVDSPFIAYSPHSNSGIPAESGARRVQTSLNVTFEPGKGRKSRLKESSFGPPEQIKDKDVHYADIEQVHKA